MTYKLNDQVVFGNNKLGSKLMFKERQRYQELFPTGSNFPQTYTFWEGDNLYYGREDQNRNAIFVNETYLKAVPNTKKSIFALGFVVDAYTDFQQWMKIQIGKKFVEDNSITKPWAAVRGWENIHDAHHEGMVQAYQSFSGQYLDQTGKHKDIRDYNTFLDLYMNDFIANILSDIPFTKSSFIRSKFSSPLISGLCIEIEQLSHSSDYEKYDKFVNNINFKTYLLAAKKFGFMVDKNAPWRLIANIESPEMRSYIAKYMLQYSTQGTTSENFTNLQTKHSHTYTIDENGNGFTNFVADPQSPGILHRHEIKNYKVIQAESSTYDSLNNVGIGPHAHQLATEQIKEFDISDIYNRFYVKSDTYDIDSLKVYMMQFYNTYATAFPNVAVPKLVSCNPSSQTTNYGITQKTKIVKVFRNLIGEKVHDEEYTDLFWTKIYFIIRLKELGANVPEPILNKNLQKITQIYNFVDKESALEYINKYLKQYY
jgi:hypothetical protein